MLLQEGLVWHNLNTVEEATEAIYKNTWTGAMEGINPAAGPVSTPLCEGEQEEDCHRPCLTVCLLLSPPH